MFLSIAFQTDKPITAYGAFAAQQEGLKLLGERVLVALRQGKTNL